MWLHENIRDGAEVEMSMLFADIRGSTALSETMKPVEFSRLINRFYTEATKIIAPGRWTGRETGG